MMQIYSKRSFFFFFFLTQYSKRFSIYTYVYIYNLVKYSLIIKIYIN